MKGPAETDQSATIRGELSFWWWIVGTLIGSLSLIAFLQKVFAVGLAPIPGLIVEYYRSAMQPLRDILSLLPFHVPEWYTELLPLSALLATAFGRAVLFYRTGPQGRSEPWLLYRVRVVLVLAASGLSFVMALGAIGVQTPEAARMRLALLSLLAVAMGFFAWNFQAQP